MSKNQTDRVTVTLTSDRLRVLEKEADTKGVRLPTYCRVLLSEIADEIKHKKAA